MGKKYDFIPNRLNKYSIRKFTVGTASILIGSLLFLGQDAEASEQIESTKTDEENNVELTTNEDQETLETTPDSTEENQKDIINDSVDNFEETSKQETEESDEFLTEESTPEEQNESNSPKEQPLETEETETSEDAEETEQAEEQPQKETSEDSNENNTPEEQPLETEESQNSEDKVEDNQTEEQPQRETPKELSEENQNESSQQESNETQESPQEELEALPKKEVSKDNSLEEQEEVVKPKEDVKVALYSNQKDENEKSAAPQEFIDKYNATTNRKEMVETMLSEVYESEDVEGIMNNLDVDYNTISANDLYNSVMYAGLEYASQQKNAFTSFAVRENPNQIYDSLEQLGEQFNLKTIDPNTGVTIKGEGSTALNQYPASYTIKAVPNRSTNNMDFTVTWKVDKNATESAHRAVVGGLNFGNAYKVPSEIKGQSTIIGNKNPITSLHNMSIGGKPGYPPGYASNTFIDITKYAVNNDGRIEYKFSIPVTDWNGDLGFNGNIGMYSQDQAGTAVRPDTFDNYFRDQHYIKVTSNPEKEFEFRDDTSDVEEIPYQIEYRVSKDVPMGEQRTIREGKNGKRGTIYTIVSYDGEDVGKLIKETYNEAPTNKLVELGIGNLDSEDEAPKPPIVDPKLSGENTITGESVPNADIQINVGGKTYTTKSDDSGRFSTTLPDYTLKQGETITATATVDGKTSQPGKTIVPRDGRTPSIKTDVVRGKNDEGKDGSWVTIRNSETNEEIDKFFVPDGEKGDKGADGESPEVEVIDNGDGTKTIFIKNPGEDEPQKAIIKDGKDGNSSVITQERGTKDGRTGVYVTVWETDSKGNQIDGTEKTEFIPDGEDGKDGQTYAPVVEKGEDGTTTIKFYPVNPETGQPDTSQDPIATGEVKDGKDGQTPNIEVVPSEDPGNPGYTIIITNPETGETEEIFVKDGQDGQDGKDGVDGEDGNTIRVENNDDGTYDIVVVDPEGNEISRNTVQDGKDGVDGEDGKDGQTYAPVVEKGEDGTTTIKFYPVDPETGQPDTSQDPIATGEVKDGKDGVDGEDGADGKDGQTPNIEVVPSEDPENPGYTIIITNPETGETEEIFVRDGQDGKDGVDGEDGNTVRVENNGDGTYDIVVVDPEGNEVSRNTVQDGKDGADGKDGQTPNIEVVPSEDPENPGYTIVITNPETGETEEIFVRDGQDGKDGVDGEDGADGKDGQTPNVETKEVKDKDGNVIGERLIFTDESGKVLDEVTIYHGRDGKDGADGKDGKDGQSVDVEVRPVLDSNGKVIGQELIFRDKETKVELDRGIIYSGKDGKDGQSVDVEVRPVLDSDGKEIGKEFIFRDKETKIELNRGIIYNGQDGKDGKDGADGKDGKDNGITNSNVNDIFIDQNNNIIVEREDGSKEKLGQLPSESVIKNVIVNVNNEVVLVYNDGKTINIGKLPTTNGKDGKSAYELWLEQGHTGTIDDFFEWLKGKDGKTPSIDSNEIKDENGDVTGVHIIIRDGDGNIVNEYDIYNGRDGKDVGTPTVETETIYDENKNELGYTIIVKDGNGNKLNEFDIRHGKDGVDGQDGESITVISQKTDKDGNITLEFSDGSTVVIPRGKDGKSIFITGNYRDENNNTVIEFSDGTSIIIPCNCGSKGSEGTPEEPSETPNEPGESEDTPEEPSETPNEPGESEGTPEEPSETPNEPGESEGTLEEPSETPNESGESEGTPEEPSETPEEPGETEGTSVQPSKPVVNDNVQNETPKSTNDHGEVRENTLPETGETNNGTALSATALLLVGTSMLAGTRRRKED